MRNAECGIAVRGRSHHDACPYIPHSTFHIPHLTPMPEDLADVYRTTYTALVRFLYRKVWSAERAEDLAQEAFARALVHRPENARGWLFVVAANMARDDARRAARERRHLTLLKSEPPPSAAPLDETLHTDSDRSQVRAALEQLTPRDREVLLLWDSGLSYDEIDRKSVV